VEAFSHHHGHPPPQNHPNHFHFQLREVTPIPTSIGAIVFAGVAHASSPTPRGSPFLVRFFSGFQHDAEFGMSFDFLDVDFGADFTFQDVFDFDSISSGSFEYDNISYELSDECMLRLQQGIH
jgi:hypothetical protein